jgi:hypothetical protein
MEIKIYKGYSIFDPDCPLKILTEILEKGEFDYISCIAAINPNCPPEAKIKWMKEHELIGKEDPKKHIIEYEYKQDNLQDLKDLL